MSRGLTAILLVTMALGGPGCGLQPTEDESTVSIKKGDVASIQRTREALGHFAHRYLVYIQNASVSICEDAKDVATRRKVALWQLFAAGQGRDAVFQQDVLAAMMDMWILCVQMRGFFDAGGAGHEVFGEHTHVALDAAKEMEADIDRVCSAVLPEDRRDEIRSSVRKFAGEHPIRLPFAREGDVSFLEQGDEKSNWGWMYHASLSPLRAIGGMDETALALVKLSEVAERSNIIASYLPNDIRLQSQLLLYEPDVQAALGSMKLVAESANRMNETAEKLPAQLSEQIGRTLEDLKENQKSIEEMLASLATFLSGLQKASVDVEKAGVALTGTTNAIHEMVNDFRGVGDKDDAAPEPVTVQPAVAADPAKTPAPYDVNDYGKAAKEIAAAAARLTDATAEVRSLVSSEMPGVTTAVGEVEGILNRVAIVGILLIAAFFGGLVAYRVVMARMSRSAA